MEVVAEAAVVVPVIEKECEEADKKATRRASQQMEAEEVLEGVEARAAAAGITAEEMHAVEAAAVADLEVPESPTSTDRSGEPPPASGAVDTPSPDVPKPKNSFEDLFASCCGPR